MTRKAIQIAAAYDHAKAYGAHPEPMWTPGVAIFALCDDGSVWTFYTGTTWEQMPAIPGANDEAKP